MAAPAWRCVSAIRSSRSVSYTHLIDYKGTLANKAKLALGYEGQFDDQSQTGQGVQGVSAALATADAAFAERFTLSQQVQALYATYEQAFGKLTVQPGLRLEETTLATDLVSGCLLYTSRCV